MAHPVFKTGDSRSESWLTPEVAQALGCETKQVKALLSKPGRP